MPTERDVLSAKGGAGDHVHLYLRWGPDGSVSDLMRTVKSRSSMWLHEKHPRLAAFAWPERSSVFSVCKSQEGAVKAYIARQAEHHAKEVFKSEPMRLLRAHAVELDERRVFERDGVRSTALPLRGGRQRRTTSPTGSPRSTRYRPRPFGAERYNGEGSR